MYAADASVGYIAEEALDKGKQQFLGEIQQVPPMYSALRVDGKRLYEMARKGQEIERKARTVTISHIDLKRDEADPHSVHFDVGCSKGTYIRSLANDLVRCTSLLLYSLCCLSSLLPETPQASRMFNWHP